MPRRRSMAAITPTEALVKVTRRGQLMKLASRATFVWVVTIAATARLLAHDPGLSSLDVRIEEKTITAVLSLAAADARVMGSQDQVSAAAGGTIDLVLDGRRLSPSATSVWTDESGGVHARMTCERPQGSQLVVRSVIVRRLPRGHRELLTIRVQDGTVRAERMLDAGFNEVATDMTMFRPEGSSFSRLFRLGVQHILTGYDHLLFLAGVLVVLRRWRDVIQTVTAFTVAHSITLGLATTGLLVIPGRIVEPLIAASIVFVGIENLVMTDGARVFRRWRAVPASRWKLTFAFGLVHGLGFATVLRDLGVGTSADGGLVLPLASFNAGVEAGQMVVASLLVPLFWWLGAQSTRRVRFAAAWSVLVIMMGSYWFVARIA